MEAVFSQGYQSTFVLTESRENKQNIALVDVNMSNILTSFVKIKKQYFKIWVKVMYHILILQ